MAVTTTSGAGKRQTRWAQATQRRYMDGYRVANSVNAFGQFIKVGGVVLGLIVWAAITETVGSGFGGFVFGLVVAMVFFVIGVVVAAHGQVLRATLDSAVHSSPFLTDDLRAAVMSLPSGRGGRLGSPEATELTAESLSEGTVRSRQSTEEGAEESAGDSFCYHCGAETLPGASKCETCGKPL